MHLIQIIKYSSMMLLKMFCGTFPWISLLFPLFLLFLDFYLIILSQLSWMLCIRNFLYLTYSLTNVFISTIISSTSKILSLSPVFCWWDLSLRFGFNFPNFSFPDFPSFSISLLMLFILIYLEHFICFFLLF